MILTEDFRSGGRCFYKVQQQVRAYLMECAEGLLCREEKLYVACPVTVRVHVQCRLAVASYREAGGIRRLAGETLRRFLDPVGGNHDGGGWDMGEAPDYGQIKACLLAIPGVCYVDLLRTAYEMETEHGFCEALWERLGDHPWILPEMGECRIAVTVD